jgi:hypothetical protein
MRISANVLVNKPPFLSFILRVLFITLGICHALVLSLRFKNVNSLWDRIFLHKSERHTLTLSLTHGPMHPPNFIHYSVK